MEYILYFFGSFSAVIVLFLVINGFFKPVLFSKTVSEEVLFAYRCYEGDYKDVGLVQVGLIEALRASDITMKRTLGIYYDDPKQVPTAKLRSVIGVEIEAKDASKISQDDIFVATYPSVNSLTTRFSYLSPLSIMLAVLRVYPAFKKYVNKNQYQAGPILELYDTAHRRIDFYFPLEEHDMITQFYKDTK